MKGYYSDSQQEIEYDEDDFIGLKDLRNEGVPDDQIYLYGLPGDDLGIVDKQAFTYDEALEMFQEWYRAGECECSYDDYISEILSKLHTADKLKWLD